MIPEHVIRDILSQSFQISEKQLTLFEKKAAAKHQTLFDVVIAEGAIDPKAFYDTLSKLWEVPLAELKGKEIPKEVIDSIPATLAENEKIVAFEKEGNTLSVAMADPTDLQTIEFIRRKTGMEVRPFLATPEDLRDVLRRFHADVSKSAGIQQFVSDVAADADPKDLKKAAEEISVVNIVNSILENAVYENASDIHIEPTENDVAVRYRIDGDLRNMMNLPKIVKGGIIARIKILANLKIDEHMVPQDGRFKIVVQDERLAFRVSIMPVYDGEKIVMRLLREGQKPLSLDQLGFQDSARAVLEAAIAKPHGMILVTGPTGSGKTTTLYSVLNILNQPDVNICTIEDPIEYHVGGINQNQINPRVGFTFAGGLRAFLRQDPDVIMVGEIRDPETAEVAVHAAMTGHLVLSTLHTNDAPTTIPRLTDMNIPPFLVAFTTNCIIAQRLVRRVCEKCSQKATISPSEKSEIEKLVPKDRLNWLLNETGKKSKKKAASLDDLDWARGKGCSRCGSSGYKGRIGMYEVMDITKDITTAINKQASAAELRDIGMKNGMITMLEDGILKAAAGITTLEEILSAARE